MVVSAFTNGWSSESASKPGKNCTETANRFPLSPSPEVGGVISKSTFNSMAAVVKLSKSVELNEKILA